MIPKQKSKIKSSKQTGKKQKDFNEIEIVRRTLENNTHESFEDTKLKKVTSWRRSQEKFFKSLVYNILTCGLLHFISLFYPNLFIKLYCNPSSANECDYFLVENIYGKFTLCKNICRKKKINKSSLVGQEKEELIDSKKPEYNLTRNLTYSFVYKSTVYEYNEEKDKIIPVYMDLSKMTNKGILDYFLSGLTTKNVVNQFEERYGKNVYEFDIKLLFLFFLNNEIPSYAIVIVICIIQTVAFPDYMLLVGKICVVAAFIIIQLINIKVTIINKYKKEITLDGNQTKIKVKRNYLLKNTDDFYKEIDLEELLPGDIIFLKENEFVPCDCIIMEGECMVSESNLTGRINIYKKTSLRDNSDLFNYKLANLNILYHGMKIIKTFSKINDNYISVLCINIGPNTYKANQYSNIFYFLERKKEYNYVYNLFGERKVIFYYIIFAFILSLIYGVIIYKISSKDIDQDKLKSLLFRTLLGCFSESLMLPYFLSHSFMILLGIFRLQGNNIICFDKSRLLNSGRINTIILNKTGTLSNDILEINGYHVPNLNLHRKGHVIYNNYLRTQSKEMNVHLLNYYKEYLEIKENSNIKKNAASFLAFNKLNQKFEYYLVMFLECLLCCNHLDKFGIDLFGNKIETNLYNDMKWDIKQYDNTNNEKENNKNIDEINIKNIKPNSESNYCLIIKKIYDIFPKNYYKLTESSKKSKNKTVKKNLLDISMTTDKSKNTLLSKNVKSFTTNPILLDINKSKTNSYKLRIYKKFIINGSLSQSAIVYNFLKEELRFMTRGYPEDIINRCHQHTVPDDLEETISIIRRNGLIVLVCATKVLDIEDYDDSEGLDYYMEDLSFCGIVTLKNKLNDNVKFSIEQINEFKCHTVISSADNEYNCLSAGFNSGIIENNNIFVFDKKDKYNKLWIRKIYSLKTKTKDEENNNIKNKANDKISKFSRISKNISQNRRKSDVNSKHNKTKDLIDNEKLINKNISNNNLLRTNSLLPKNNVSNLEDFSEIRKLNDISNINLSEINNLDVSNFDQAQVSHKIKKEKVSFKPIKINENKEAKSDNDNDINLFENITYYHGIFDDFEDLKNGTYCISSDAFNFLYKNRTYKGIKYILEKIIKSSKIFFNMSSIDKSRLIDYFRESGDNVVCSLGECDSDLDAIISSNVGVSLKNPPNQNMILCHFYSTKKDIISLKNIITIGRLLYENSILLEIVSFSCAISINFFLMGSLTNNLDIEGFLKNDLRFLDLENLILELFSFAGSPKEKTNMIKNKKLLNLYYIVQLIALLLFKLLSIYLFNYLFEKDTNLEEETKNREYMSFFFILCIEFVINSIFIFNHISFYREPPFSNITLTVSSLLIFIYVILLICFNSSNFVSDFFGLTNFAFSDNLVDTYSDQNRLWLTITLCFDFAGAFLFCSILYIVFDFFSKQNNIFSKLSIKRLINF